MLVIYTLYMYMQIHTHTHTYTHTKHTQVIYTLPDLDPALEKEMIEAPYETKSDSFYFVGNKMVMHNKVFCLYRFVYPNPKPQPETLNPEQVGNASGVVCLNPNS